MIDHDGSKTEYARTSGQGQGGHAGVLFPPVLMRITDTVTDSALLPIDSEHGTPKHEHLRTGKEPLEAADNKERRRIAQL